MASVNIPRTFIFSDATSYSAGMIESEFDNIIRIINNANSGLLTWDNVKAVTVAFTNPVPVASGGTNSSSTLNNNRFIVSSGGKLVEAGSVSASKVVVSDVNGLPAASAVTTTTLAFLDATSSVQTQLNGKQATITAGQLPGTATNDTASAGNVGQYVESVIAATNSPASTHWGDLTSIALTAGDWDVTAVCQTDANGSGTPSGFQLGISVTTGDFSTGLTTGSSVINISTCSPNFFYVSVPAFRMSLSGNTTVYMKNNVTYASGQYQVRGARLSARRVR